MADFSTLMRRATESVRSGDLSGATGLIQSALGGKADALQAPQDAPPRRARLTQTLSQTLAKLRQFKAAMPDPGAMPAARAEAPVTPGARFERGSFTCAHGSRDYRVYVPATAGDAPKGLIVLLHGCTQSPEDFAAGTRMNALADQHGLVVLYPGQSRGANMQSCWNWFAPADQGAGQGEPAILAGMTRQIAADHNIAETAIFAAGLSAGAAMAVILGEAYPTLFSAIGVHSGLPYRSASDVPSAFAAMQGTGAQTVHAPAASLRTIVFHGTADKTVHPANGTRIAERAAGNLTEIIDKGRAEGRDYTRTTALDAQGLAVMELWEVAGLGHAWSGGSADGSYADPKGPDASAEMVRFFFAGQPMNA